MDKALSGEGFISMKKKQKRRNNQQCSHKERSIPMYNAYFISPRGKIIPVLHGTHIKQIDSDPRRFGLTDSYIDEIFKKFDESRGFEGYGREEVIAGLFLKGWTRVRFEAGGYLIFQAINFTAARMRHILNFLVLVQKARICPCKVDGRFFVVLVFHDRNNPVLSAERVADAIKDIQNLKNVLKKCFDAEHLSERRVSLPLSDNKN